MKNKGFFLIQELQRTGRPVFTVSEAMTLLQVSHPSTMAILTRLRRDRLITTLTNGLYGILQATEQTYGLRPLRILDPLMQHLGAHYYVGLLSAANHWGAAHHKPQILQVVTADRHFLRRLEKLKMQFYIKKHFFEEGLVTAKAPFGYYKISSPELTALDIISHEKSCGGFNNVCLVVRDLINDLRAKPLLACCKNYGVLSSIQKLGYMLEKYKSSKKLRDPLLQWLQKQEPSPIPLLARGERKGLIHKNWKIIENAALEFEE